MEAIAHAGWQRTRLPDTDGSGFAGASKKLAPKLNGRIVRTRPPMLLFRSAGQVRFRDLFSLKPVQHFNLNPPYFFGAKVYSLWERAGFFQSGQFLR